MTNARLSLQDYKDGLLKSDRIVLAKAITLVESALPSDQEMASELIDSVLERTGNSIRLGISGVPGVGKSTFIEALGSVVTAQNKKIAVLTVDPSSSLTKGSILGDKTRMQTLAKNKLAFIRPSAAGDSLGGVGSRTRESILLCEAAGYEVIIVETVGVGQSEIAIKNMVDFFLLLMLAGAGDELQGIKKGIMEVADLVVITKADGDNKTHATEAQSQYQQALHLQPGRASGWVPKVLTCSAYANKGIKEVWATVQSYISKVRDNGFMDQNREHQNISWFADHLVHLMRTDFQRFENVQREKESLEKEVAGKKISPRVAAQKLMEVYRQEIANRK